MSGHLSQEEIDKLMQESNDSSSEEVEETVGEVDDVEEPYENMERPVLTDFEIDGLGEIGNISMGTASTTLNILLNQEVSITTPEVEVVDWEEAVNPNDQDFIIIEVNYTEGFSGSSVLLIKKDDAKIIADLMMGGDGTNVDDELNDFHLSAISEAMNQMVGTSATSMSKIFDITVDIAPPKVIVEKPKDYNYKELFINSPTPYFVKTSFRIVIGDLIDSRIMQLLGLPFALDMFNTLINDGEDSISSEETSSEKAIDESPVEETMPEAKVEEEKLEEPEKTEPPKPSIFSKEGKNIDLLLNVPMDVTVELGRTNKMIKDVLNLGPGSVIELDNFSGEKVDILVNGKKIALGEVVVVDESYGVRVTDIIKVRNRF
ncbi:MAG: flagellar motor switch phosphatase FliY [Bacillota bacterium]|nr:flagellar motor switch phosphatase FliY [Bacillota bacterium]